MVEVVRPSTKPYIEIEGTYWVPEGVELEHTEYIVPFEVIRYVAERLNMDEPHNVGIDPMCGNGIIVSAVNELEGFCMGIELDRRHSEIARSALSQIVQPMPPPGWLLGKTPQITHGDCTEVDLPKNNLAGYLARYLYTSPGFREILDGTFDDDMVRTFGRMLVPPGAAGFIVIDSADEAVRDGKVVNPAAATIERFEQAGFPLLDRVGFRITNAPSGYDDQFTELMFVRQEELDFWEWFNPKPFSS